MKVIKKISKLAAAGALLTAFAFNFNACSEQTPFESGNREDLSVTLNKGPKRAADSIVLPEVGDTVGTTTEKGSMVSRYSKKWDAYQGGKIILSQGSQFELLYGSLTPPAELHGQNVTLTMTAEQTASNELLFEFGPHGSQFDPPATVWFHYTGSNPKLYYVQEDGSYIEQQPDEVDSKNQWLMLKINHFSRYALAWSR